MFLNQFWKVFRHGQGLVKVLSFSKIYCNNYYLQGLDQVYFSHYVMLMEVLFNLSNMESKYSYAHVISFQLIYRIFVGDALYCCFMWEFLVG